MAEKISITLFDEFKILKGNRQILVNLSNTRKTKLFVAYLLVNRDRAISHQELFELLWSGEDFANPGTAMRTLLYRFRAMIDKEGADQLSGAIISRRGTYQWNRNIDVSIDVLEFEELVNTGLSKTCPMDRKKECLSKALEIYKGSLLPDFRAEPWMVAKGAYYRDMYIDATQAYIEILKREEKYAQIIEVCDRAMEIAGTTELLELESTMAKSHAASGATHSDNLERYYKQVRSVSEILQDETQNLQSDLEDEKMSRKAFVCEYRVFKEIYHLQRRTFARSKHSLFLGVVEVRFEENSEEINNPVKLEKMMNEVIEYCAKGLRCGDAICRRKDLQLAILFPSESYETAMGVLERLKTACKENMGEELVFAYKVKALKNANE